MTQFDSEERMDILSRMNQNWPGKFLIPRLKFFSKELNSYDNDVLSQAVTHVLRTCDWPPTIAKIEEGCRKAEKARALKGTGKKVYKPGDTVPGVGRTITPREAKQLLEALLEKNPNAWRKVAPRSRGLSAVQEERGRMEQVVDHIMYNAYRVCMAHDPSVESPNPTQEPEDDGQLGLL